MRFRNRLVLFLLILLIAVQSLTAAVVYLYARHAMLEEAGERLSATSNAFAAHLDSLAVRVRNGVEVLAQDYGLRQAAATGDHPTMLSVLRNHGRRIGAARTLFLDLSGHAIADTAGATEPAAESVLAPLADIAVAEGQAAALATLGDTTCWLVVMPVRAPETLGFIAACVPVDNAVLDELLNLSATPAAISLVATSGGQPRLLAQSAAGRAPVMSAGWAPQEATQRVRVGGGEALVYARPLPTAEGSPAVTLLIAYPLRSVVNSNWDIFAPLGAIFLLAGALSLLGAVWIARDLSRPIETLAKGAARIGHGDYSAADALPRNGELGLLSGALTSMAHAVEERETALRASAAELARARDAAERADRAKTLFLANMSHELRTPLNAIMGLSHIMKLQQFGPLGDKRYSEYARLISDSGGQLLGLVSRILSLVQIETRQLKLERRIADAGALARDAQAEMAHAAEDAGVTMVFAPLAGEALVDVDVAHMLTALKQVMHNAIKFTPRGGRVGVAVEGGDRVRIRIADTGIGISPEKIGEVTKPFYRASDAHDAKYAGAGVGLTLTAAIVEQHGGILTIESPPEGGARVTIDLPRAKVPAARAVA